MRFLVILGIMAGMLAAATIASVPDSIPGCLPGIESAMAQKSQQKKDGQEQKKDEEPEKEEEEEKERSEKKKRGEEERSSSSSSGSSLECLTDCLYLGDMLFGDTPEDEERDLEPRVLEITEEYQQPLTGIMELEQESTVESLVWDTPGGELASSGTVFHVPVGEEILIWKKAAAMGDTAWLEISSLDSESERGWVRARDVSIDDTQAAGLLVAGSMSEDIAPGDADETEGATALESMDPVDSMEQGESAESPEYLEPPSWDRTGIWLRGDLIWYTFAGDPLEEEYDGRGYQFRGMLHLRTSSTFQVGAGVGYARGHGNPGVVYDSPSIFEEPLDSDLYILSLELQAGQHILLGAPRLGSFLWGIGPTLFKVKESAEIAYTEYDDGQPGRSGIRTDTNTRWVLGFEGRMVLARLVEDKYPLGFVAAFSFIPWDSNQKESLTLDWLERDYFFTIHLGLTFGVFF